ncbi:hypothetical protein MNBD_GAMMA07-2002 [hydrothermal vent metagenome]|uniref:HTH marR-type domain-containing protein n=1 Tax=hydrothermal vent metagenome TaxID=652676 RepID=A0A3B0X187_9ZZZZ
MVDLKHTDMAQNELNVALEMLHFGFRAITHHPDQRLKEIGYTRVHHRILYFIGRNPETCINGLLATMQVSKQYLNRPLNKLVDDGYVDAWQDDKDKRMKRLSLSSAGLLLEKNLTGEQRKQLSRVFTQAGPEAEAGWRKIMELLARVNMK